MTFLGNETLVCGRPWDQVDQVDSDVSKWHCISWTLGMENHGNCHDIFLAVSLGKELAVMIIFMNTTTSSESIENLRFFLQTKMRGW